MRDLDVKVLLVGCNLLTPPVELREQLAFDRTLTERALHELSQRAAGAEFVLLSTCNRVEIYAAADSPENSPTPDQLVQFLADFHSLDRNRIDPLLYCHNQLEAVQHLFEVAAGLDSMVPGEGQILAQVKEGYRLAHKAGLTRSIMNMLFQRAIAVAKRIHSEIAVAQKKVSVSSVAVDFACEIFEPEHFPDKTVLIIGAGKMGELTLRHLLELKPGRVLVSNRSAAKATELAEKLGGIAVPFHKLDDWLAVADLIVSTPGSTQPLVDKQRFAAVMGRRCYSPVFIIDIAVPRDFDSAVGELENVYLYNIDDLERQRQLNLAERRREVEKGRIIAEREAEAFLRELNYRMKSAPVILQLRRKWDKVRQGELENLFERCPDLTDQQRQAIAKCFERFQNQLLHQPLAALRDADDTPQGLLNALRRLFRLGRSE